MNENEKNMPLDDDGFLPDSGFARKKEEPAPGTVKKPESSVPQKNYTVRRVTPSGTRPIPRPQPQAQKVNPQPQAQPTAPKVTPVPQTPSTAPKVTSAPQPQPAAPKVTPTPQAQPAAPKVTPVPQTPPTAPKVTSAPQPQPTAPKAAPAPQAQPTVKPAEPKSVPVQQKAAAPQIRHSHVIYSPVPDKTAIHDVITDSSEIKPTKVVNLSAGGKKKKKAASGTKSAVKALIYIVAVLTFSIFISYAGIIIANDAFAFVKADEEIRVTIPELMTTSELADILHEEGAIKYPFIFKIYCGRNAKDVEFVAGEYVINANSSYDELFATFKKSTKRETVRVSFPEGSTIDEMIALLVENGVGCADGFREVINNYDFSAYEYGFLEGVTMTDDKYYRLEGFLFPDTYDFYKARGIEEGDGIYIYQDEVNAIIKFLDRFEQIFTEDLKLRAEELGMSIEEIITLASIIEKEGKFVVEFEKISSVFHNRLNDRNTYPKLQSDATIAYAMQCDSGTRPEELTGSDTDYDSVYNTYLYSGLPPGAIANPGYNAITCALYPASTEYFFFVSKKDGTTLFAKTEPEHLENIIIARGE